MASIEKRKNGRGIIYRVKVRLKGFPSQNATFEKLSDAKRWVQQTESAIREGRYFKTNESKRHTMSDAIERYKKHVLPNKPKSIVMQTIHLNWWKKAIGSYTLADVTPSVIINCRDKLSEEITFRHKQRSPATVNRYLSVLSHLFTVAFKEWEWVNENPFRKVTSRRESRGRVRFLSDDERFGLLKECENSSNSYLYLIVVLALSTGARRGEILGIQWKDVDFKRGVITLHETKNGERRVLPLVGRAFELTKQHFKDRDINCDLLFPGRDLKKSINVRTTFESALKRAKIKDFRFHDLRHSCASYLAMNGASLAEISEVLGHKTLQMVKRYAHLSESHTSKVVARMNEKIFS